jgi:hypothetical protein
MNPAQGVPNRSHPEQYAWRSLPVRIDGLYGSFLALRCRSTGKEPPDLYPPADIPDLGRNSLLLTYKHS